ILPIRQQLTDNHLADSRWSVMAQANSSRSPIASRPVLQRRPFKRKTFIQAAVVLWVLSSRRMSQPPPATVAQRRQPHGPSPTTGGPPSGPGGRRNERQWQNLNSQMQSSNAAGQTSRTPDVSFRGAAANRQHGFGVSSPMAAPSPASQMEPPLQPGNMSSRIDGPQSRPDSRIEQRQDLFQLGGGAEENRHKHRGEERSERHRSSRNPSRERGREDELPLKPLPQAMGDGRERRGGREERRDREERNRRESGREARGPRGEEARRPVEMTGAFSGPPQPAYAPEWARDGGRGGRRDGPADDGRRGGGRGQPRGEDMRSSRREEERRENGRGPPRDDEGVPDGRKRRHDEVPFEGSKRRRSGR
ncbi:hypothetical protein KC352_g32186, partial [Hortaea werneckii]